MTSFLGSNTDTLYIMQMHFLLAPYYFKESSLPKVNVFVSNGVDAGSVTWQSCSLLAVFVSSSLWAYLSCPSKAISLFLQTSLEEKNFLLFWCLKVRSTHFSKCPAELMLAVWKGHFLSKLYCKKFPLLHSAIMLAPFLLLYASQGDLTNPRPDRECSRQLSTPGIFKPTVLSDTLHCVRVLHHIWMTCHHFLQKSPDLPTWVHAKSLQFCLTLCNPLDYSPPVSSVHGSLWARILEWVAVPSSRGSSQLRERTHDSYVFYTGRQVLYH